MDAPPETRILPLWREIRATARTLPAGGPAGFAEALLRRYGRAPRPAAPPDTALRRPAAPVFRPTYQQVALHVHPRLELALARVERRTALEREVRLEREAALERQIERVLAPQVRLEQSAAAAEQIVARLAARAERQAAADAPPSPEPRGRPDAAPPIVTLAQRAPAAGAPGAQPEPPRPGAPAQALWPAQGPAAPGLGAPDLRRLTDQVVEAIDRRARAARERLGGGPR
jgi:hypothetical protein